MAVQFKKDLEMALKWQFKGLAECLAAQWSPQLVVMWVWQELPTPDRNSGNLQHDYFGRSHAYFLLHFWCTPDHT